VVGGVVLKRPGVLGLEIRAIRRWQVIGVIEQDALRKCLGWVVLMAVNLRVEVQLVLSE
jgi:hypothetical protein